MKSMKRYFGNNGTPRETCSAFTKQIPETVTWNRPPKGSRIIGSKNQRWGVDFLLFGRPAEGATSNAMLEKALGFEVPPALKKYTSTKVLWKLPQKKGPCSKRKSFSDHFSFAGDMLVFMGVRHSNMACHKGQWWWVDLDDAFNECSHNVPIWFVCAGG